MERKMTQNKIHITSKIHTAPKIRKNIAEEVLQAFRTYLASHPAAYLTAWIP